MTDEIKKLLKLILEEEEANEAGQKKPNTKKNKVKPPEDKPEPKKPETIEEHRKADLERVRKEMYAPHDNNKTAFNDVPLWAKYALTLPEATEYFHIGYNKLREIVRKDKYAEYLMWNGGRVYIKRRLFEEFLNKTTEL